MNGGFLKAGAPPPPRRKWNLQEFRRRCQFAQMNAASRLGGGGALALQKPPKWNAYERGLPEAGAPPPP